MRPTRPGSPPSPDDEHARVDLLEPAPRRTGDGNRSDVRHPRLGPDSTRPGRGGPVAPSRRRDLQARTSRTVRSRGSDAPRSPSTMSMRRFPRSCCSASGCAPRRMERWARDGATGRPRRDPRRGPDQGFADVERHGGCPLAPVRRGAGSSRSTRAAGVRHQVRAVIPATLAASMADCSDRR